MNHIKQNMGTRDTRDKVNMTRGEEAHTAGKNMRWAVGDAGLPQALERKSKNPSRRRRPLKLKRGWENGWKKRIQDGG